MHLTCPEHPPWPEANNKVEGSRGIAQWNNNRWESRLLNLQTFAGEELKLDWEFCLTAQLNFVLWEFGIIESEGSGSLKGALKLLQKTNTVEEAALQFEKYYEFSDKKSLQDRIDAAIAIYNIFT